MNHKSYLIRLTPCDRFFFGQNRKGELGNRQDYFATSTLFPQQTTLLGMLRYQLLLQNGHTRPGQVRFTATQTAIDLIGPESFGSSAGSGYGVIKKLSPVFVCRDTNIFLVRNHEYPSDGSKTGAHPAAPLVEASEQSRMYAALSPPDGKASTAFRYPNLQAKHGFAARWRSPSNTEYTRDQIFIKEELAHNNKSLRGTSLEQGYFKEIAYRFRRGFSFGCYVDLADGNYRLENNFVTLGGRRTRFKLELLPRETGFMESVKSLVDTQSRRHLLLSDAYLKKDYLTQCRAVFGAVTPFRHLRTSTKNTRHNYYQSVDFSDMQYLLRKGSLLYLKQQVDFKDLVKDFDAYHTIGYNYAIPISEPEIL